jgi:quinol monooxygenase YgiN
VKFVQTIRFSTARIDEIRALSQEYDRDSGAAAGSGFLGAKVLKDRGRDNAYMVVAEFESYEQAMENSARPETDAFARRMGELVDGELGYDNYDVLEEMTPGS